MALVTNVLLSALTIPWMMVVKASNNIIYVFHNKINSNKFLAYVQFFEIVEKGMSIAYK